MSPHHQRDLAPIVKAVPASYLNEIVEGEQYQQTALLAEKEQIYSSRWSCGTWLVLIWLG
jgi:hypothetical protein